MRTSLMSENVASGVRNALTKLLDVNFYPSQPSGAPVAVLPIDGSSLTLSNFGMRTLQYDPGSSLRYLSDKETEENAVGVLRALGKVLGPKYGACFVDSCIADLFDACVSRTLCQNISASQMLMGPSHIAWLHEWIGSIALAHEVTLGAFNGRINSSTECDLSKNDRRQQRLLAKLASSVLPVVVSSPLWDLPTSRTSLTSCPNTVTSQSPQISAITRHDPMGLDRLLAYSENAGSTTESLRGNACVSIRLLS